MTPVEMCFQLAATRSVHDLVVGRCVSGTRTMCPGKSARYAKIAGMRVNWEHLAESPKRAEHLFDLLMRRLYGEDVQTINGAGGDGGYDAWIETQGRAVEFKSFTKLGKSQRDQVVRSLKRAATRNPDSWALVAPVHPTPRDLAWFDGLRDQFSFELVLQDVRWLEAQLAAHPDLINFVAAPVHEGAYSLTATDPQQAILLDSAPKQLQQVEVRADFFRHISLPPTSTLVTRRGMIAEIKRLLLATPQSGAAHDVTATPVVLWGMGGIGKTVTARMICDDPEIQQAFSNGILWANAQDGSGAEGQLRQWINALGDDTPRTLSTVDELKNRLSTLLDIRRCLLIVDDIRSPEELTPYMVYAPECRILITTRSVVATWDTGARSQKIPRMSTRESLALLRSCAAGGRQHPRWVLKLICERVGHLPLALKLAGRQLRRVSPWDWLGSFEKIQDLDATSTSERPSWSIGACFKISVEDMDDTLRRLYFSLGAFRIGEEISEAIVARLWARLAGLDANASARALNELADRALLDLSGRSGRTVSFHPLIRQWNREGLCTSPLAERQAHEAILDSYRPGKSSQLWHTCEDDGYLYDHLIYHLRAAGDNTELVSLFDKDEWLLARVAQSDNTYDNYVADVSIAWTLAEDEVKRVGASEENTLAPAQLLKYLLLGAKIDSIASNHVPELVARAVETGLWTMNRALSVAHRMSDPEDRGRLQTLLLNRKDLESTDREDLDYSAFAAAVDIDLDSVRSEAFARLTPLLADDDLRAHAIEQGWQSALAGLEEDQPWAAVRALNLLAPYVDQETRDPALSEAMINCLSWDFEAMEAAFSWLAPRASAAVAERVLDHAFTEGDWIIPAVLKELAPYLSATALERALEACANVVDPDLLDSSFFDNIVFNLNESAFEIALDLVESIPDDDIRADALLSLAEQLPSSALPRGLAAIQTISTPDKKIEAFALLLHKLDADHRSQIDAADLEAAKQLRDEWDHTYVYRRPDSDADERRRILDASVDELLEKPQTKMRDRTLGELAPKLDGPTLERCLRAAAIGSESSTALWKCAEIIANLGLHSPSDLAAQGGHFALDIAETMEHKGEGMSRFASKLRGSAFDRCRSIAMSLQPSDHKADVLHALATQLTGQDRQIVLDQWLEAILAMPSSSWRGEDQARAFTCGAENLPLRKRRAIAQRILSNQEWGASPRTLISLGPFLPPQVAESQVERALRLEAADSCDVLAVLSTAVRASTRRAVALHAIDRFADIGNQYKQARALERIAASKIPELLRHAEQASRNFDDGYCRAIALVALAKSCMVPDRSTLLNETFDAIDQIDNFQLRADMLVKLAPALDSSQLDKIVSAANKFGMASFKVEVLASILPAASNDLSIMHAVRESLPAVFREFAGNTFDAVMAFCPLQAAFRPPVVAPEACALAARETYEITQRWRWL